MANRKILIGLTTGLAVLISFPFFVRVKEISASDLSVRTSEAFGVTSDSAYLSGLVNPGNTEAFFRFEYAPQGGQTVTTDLSPAGVGDYERIVSWQAQNLIPDTVYFYRLVAGNRLGTVAGHTLTFHTSPSRAKSDSYIASPLSSLGGPFSWLGKSDSSKSQQSGNSTSGSAAGSGSDGRNNPANTGQDNSSAGSGNSANSGNSAANGGKTSFWKSVWNFLVAVFLAIWKFFLKLWWLLVLLLLFLAIMVYWFFFHKPAGEESVEEIILKAREEFDSSRNSDPEYLGSSGDNKKRSINIDLG